MVGGGWFWDDSSTLIYCAFCFCYFISSTSDHQALDPRSWGPLLQKSAVPQHRIWGLQWRNAIMTNPQPSKEGARGVDACVPAKLLQSCPTFLQPYGLQPARLLSPWHSPGSNTGVGCHFLLQGNLPDPGIEPTSFTSPALAVRFFTTRVIWEAQGSKNLEPSVHRVQPSTSRKGWRVHLQAQIENSQNKVSSPILCRYNKENQQREKLLKVFLEPHIQHPQWLIFSKVSSSVPVRAQVKMQCFLEGYPTVVSASKPAIPFV